MLPNSIWITEGPNAERIAGIALSTGVQVGTPDSADLIIVTLLGEDASTATQRLGLDTKRCMGIDALFGLESHRTLVATPSTNEETRAAALAVFTADGKAASVIEDSPGAIAQRVLATIVNVASDIAQQRIATPADIDAAVMLGLGYPQGPLAWGDAIGPRNILQILETLLAITGDPRYRASLWLRRRAQLGLSLMHLEG
jgi:3-hydroxybutyryl-CoA dehydrogenase